MNNEQKILIAGIGNIFLGDDAFGSEVARRLEERAWPHDMRVEDFGIRGFDLAFALFDGYELTILVDAVPRGGVPGTLYKIEPDLDALDELSGPEMSIETHAMNPMKVLAMVKSMGGVFRKVVLIGCEPTPLASEDGQMGLSVAVETAIPQAIRMIEDVIAEARPQRKEISVAA
jgi:hydrogenase maturation protease